MPRSTPAGGTRTSAPSLDGQTWSPRQPGRLVWLAASTSGLSRMRHPAARQSPGRSGLALIGVPFPVAVEPWSHVWLAWVSSRDKLQDSLEENTYAVQLSRFRGHDFMQCPRGVRVYARLQVVTR